MGLFNWFRKRSRAVAADDKVWLTEEAKLRGIGRELAEGLTQDDFVIVVSHFPKSLQELRTILENTSLNFDVCDDRLTGDEVVRQVRRHDQNRVVLVLSEWLSVDDGEDWHEQEQHSGSVLIIVTERHPLPDPDRAIQQFADALPLRSRVVFHVSLEDPLLKTFAGDWVVGMLRNLGMSETEPVSSHMVTQRLKDAQRKVAESVFGNEPADSADEWFEHNHPSFTR